MRNNAKLARALSIQLSDSRQMLRATMEVGQQLEQELVLEKKVSAALMEQNEELAAKFETLTQRVDALAARLQ